MALIPKIIKSNAFKVFFKPPATDCSKNSSGFFFLRRFDTNFPNKSFLVVCICYFLFISHYRSGNYFIIPCALLSIHYNVAFLIVENLVPLFDLHIILQPLPPFFLLCLYNLFFHLCLLHLLHQAN